MSLIWIGQLPFLLGIIFYLLTVLFSIQSRQKIPLWFIFTLGLLTHELVLLAPLTWIVLTIAYPRKFSFSWSKLFSYWWPAGLYLIFRLIIFPIPLGGTYQPNLGRNTLSALAWYLLWMFNLPEQLKYQSIISKLIIMPQFILKFGDYLKIWTYSFLFILSQGLVLPLLSKPKLRSVFLGTAIVLINLSPLLITPDHQYPFYLAFALPGFLLIIGSLVAQFLHQLKSPVVKKSYLATIVFVWLLSSWLTLKFTQSNHWTIQEAKRVSYYQQKLKEISLPAGPVDVIIKSDYQVKESLADQLGIRFFTQNEQVVTHYLSPDQITNFVSTDRPVFFIY